ncbi:MAG TPA: LacI family DNA-binding transcriptional regulator [Candidatus Avipropionibacterium avicola]|uniref:LacI family DNA-binding transcriptional regulator n=1 Tax=Candidatus Avipropionibacterium avicola TaxID=2840701 RepID=A0A9D1GZ00_9ACTN|nr:LacI family DNA-binding transcriptional regulator [Candidatus Avipropionibacterium avicola]
MAARRARLRDIAEALDLSVNTVSRALAGKSDVSARTRELIRAEAERIGYVPNIGARSLVLGSTMTIGLVITNPSNPFYAQLISAIELSCRAAGYSLVLGISAESPELEAGTVDTLLRSGVDGAIVVPVQADAGVQAGNGPWQRLQSAGIPVVLVNRDLTGSGWDFVGTDNEIGAHGATLAALRGGAHSIVLVEEDLPITTIQQRITGFQRALTESGVGVTDDNVVTVPTRRSDDAALPWQADEGYRMAQRILDERTVDAVVVGNDYFALGVYRAIAERGLRVPEDVAVVGFGDHPYAAYLDPALTTVRLPAAEVGRSAMERLLHRLGEDTEPVTRLLVPPTLVERSSTRPD